MLNFQEVQLCRTDASYSLRSDCWKKPNNWRRPSWNDAWQPASTSSARSRSIYRWQGAIEDQQEYLLIIKTTSERAADLEAAFAELHPYELPEHVELSIAGGGADYLEWLSAQVAGE